LFTPVLPLQDSAGGSKGGRVTWEDAKQCNDYVNALQTAAERVAAQNRKLRAVHTRLTDDVAGLLRRCGS
jgi:dynein heavy chain 2